VNAPISATISLGDPDSIQSALHESAQMWRVRLPLVTASALTVSDRQWEAAIVEPLLFAFQAVQAAMRSDRPPRELTFHLTAENWIGLAEVSLKAIRCFCRSAAIEMGPRKIAVHGICGAHLDFCEPLLKTAPTGTWIDLRQRIPVGVGDATKAPCDTICRRIAIVTGGGNGIGRATAKHLAKDSFAIVIVDRDANAAADVAEGILQTGVNVATVVGDVADRATLQSAARTANQWGRITSWINNAASCRRSSIPELTTEEWRYAIAVNLKPAVIAAQLMSQSPGRAAIVNISSTAARSAGLLGPGRYNAYAPYCSTKAGLDALTPVLARELGHAGITVNAVAPGPVLTELSTRLYSTDDRQEIERLVPLSRFATPEEIADTVSFLASPQARYITGQVIRVDGGLISTWPA
jgi:3-oxoacyl-[acyl-carrier protein] reductase